MDITAAEKQFRQMQVDALRKGDPVPEIGNSYFGTTTPQMVAHIRQRAIALGCDVPAPPDAREAWARHFAEWISEHVQ